MAVLTIPVYVCAGVPKWFARIVPQGNPSAALQHAHDRANILNPHNKHVCISIMPRSYGQLVFVQEFTT